jgi:two-component system, NtrC family, response regulator AtoC
VTEPMIATIRLLVVSREPQILRSLWSIGETNSWQLETAASGWDAMERVQSGVAPDLLLLDLPRGDGDSLHILRWLRRLRPELRVLVSCHPEDCSRKKEATRLGAEGVLVRPFTDEQLERLIRKHLSEPENGATGIVSEDIEQLGQESFFVSASPIMQRLRAQAELLAQADVPVLILGEGGSGRSTVARLIHKLSVRSGFRFLNVDCGAVPGDMLEAELFGSDRPFPSNGHRANPGKFEAGEKGTIFLDEITEMPLSLQGRLLQILHDKTLVKPGSDRPVPVDVHILAATSVNIDRALAEKKLREDLYYRLSAFTVHVPPLRQRRDEIAVLLRHLMHKLARHYGLPPREFSPNVLDACQDYAWPGNVNELETFVKRYLVAGDQELSFPETSSTSVNGNGKVHLPLTLKFAAAPAASGGNGNGNGESHSGQKSLKSLVQSVKCEAEKNAIGAALERTGWNRKAAARLLEVSYRTLLYKIEQYHMTAAERFISPLPGERLALQGQAAKNGKVS